MRQPAISVLLPVRNGALFLARALESLRAQSLEDFEIIAVDDGSNDQGRTVEILEQYASSDPRMRVLRRGHEGIASALNTAAAHASGRFWARMDADDECFPDRFALQASYLDRHPHADAVGCRVVFGGDPELAAGYARHVGWLNSLVSHEEMALGVFRDAPLAHPSVMFRGASLRRFGGYRQGDFPEDYELWLRWLFQGARLAKLEQTLLVWNDPPGRLSRSDPRYGPQAFHSLKAGFLARWLARHNPHHPDIWVVGAGRPTRRRAEYLCGHGVRIAAYLDIDPRKIGRAISGRPVLHHEELPDRGRIFVVSYVSTPGAPEQVAAFLQERGYALGKDYIQAG